MYSSITYSAEYITFICIQTVQYEMRILNFIHTTLGMLNAYFLFLFIKIIPSHICIIIISICSLSVWFLRKFSFNFLRGFFFFLYTQIWQKIFRDLRAIYTCIALTNFAGKEFIIGYITMYKVHGNINICFY